MDKTKILEEIAMRDSYKRTPDEIGNILLGDYISAGHEEWMAHYIGTQLPKRYKISEEQVPAVGSFYELQKYLESKKVSKSDRIIENILSCPIDFSLNKTILQNLEEVESLVEEMEEFSGKIQNPSKE